MAGKKVLVADDSLTIQKVIRLALSNEGYEIHAVSDGEDALQQISVFRPNAVLIDISLPGRTAFEVKRATNEQDDLKDVRFILMSSAFERIDETQGRELNFDGRLTKPFDPAHLRQVLAEVLASTGKRPADTAPALNAAPPTPPIESAPATPSFSPPLPPPANPTPVPPRPTFVPPLPPPSLAGAAASSAPTLAPAFTAPPPPAPFVPTPPPPTPPPIETWMAPPPPPPWESAIEAPLPPPPLPAAPLAPPADDHLWDPDPSLDWAATEEPTTPLPDPPMVARPEPTAKLEVAPPLLARAPKDDDADIKHLTESTIRMSGLDDFEWSVQEPSLKPSASAVDDGGTTFRFDGPAAAAATPPLPPGADLPEELLEERERPPAPMPAQTVARPRSVLRAPAPEAPSVSEKEIDAMIKDHVERAVREALERVAQNILPEVAEKILKQEIHRMLSEI